MRMRTIEAAHAELLAADPGCELTKTALRRLVVSGAVPSTKVGAKYLVDMDRLETALFHPALITDMPGKIRPLGVRV